MLTTIRALRGFANARRVLLAGCEEMSLLDGFMPYLEADAYDVLMPDGCGDTEGVDHLQR
ncbi:MAG TPA: hypothetical protein VF814_19395, partial [Casimicrobiaceae bacterium]